MTNHNESESNTMANSTSIRNRTALTIGQKIEISEKLECGASVRNLANEYQIHPTTVRRIRRNIMSMHHLAEQGMQVWKRKKLRKPAFEDIENRLYVWWLEQKTLGDPVTDLLLHNKALELNEEFGGPSTFKASAGWIAKFKNRHNIRLLHKFEKHEGDDMVEEEHIEQDNMEEVVLEEKAQIEYYEEDTSKVEIQHALETLSKYAEQAPRFIKLTVENLKDYFLREET
ncbi:jerky protein homolog-like [Megalopta genalis]|uniref:jerky protein homolog-like n=1 Tax=Megalopta genalis TaxID=115081 RepID=UPI001442F285|nr:jerky protein homolog-like [Megalopta genalis]XP_033333818.1 jerky protein homolog-like [Megalopta genalis]